MSEYKQYEDGIYNDISIRDYHMSGGHSATNLKAAKKSLALWHWNKTHPQERKSHFDFGNAFELALLDKTGFEKDVCIMQTEVWAQMALKEKPELKMPKMSAKYKAEESKFMEGKDGKYIIPDVGQQSFETIELMLESCHRDATIQKLISGTEYQLSLYWTDEATGLKLKTRPDICKRKKNVIVNLKTAEDGSPKQFSRDLAAYDYPLQAAIEITGCLKTGLMDTVDNYFWLVVEKHPPYNATIYEFQKSDIEYSFDELEYLVKKLARAKEQKLYPGYTDRADNEFGILTAEIPVWYKTIFS